MMALFQGLPSLVSLVVPWSACGFISLVVLLDGSTLFIPLLYFIHAPPSDIFFSYNSAQ